MSKNFKLNEEQLTALSLLESGMNVALIGGGGVGKTTIINSFVETMEKQGKNVLKFAPTGIAAIQIDGITLHRGFGLPRNIIYDPTILKVPAPIIEADIVIIDEVSMVRIDMFEAIVEIIKKADIIRLINKKKQIQIVLLGDFLQLPPVVTQKDKEILEMLYPEMHDYYAFNSSLWNDLNLYYVFLSKVVRQSSEPFIRALNDVRYGRARSLSYFNQCVNRQLSDKAVTITGLNRSANEINQEKLALIKNEKEILFEADIDGDVNESDMCVDKEICLKKGCRVMAIKNDIDYKNGSLGIVTAIKPYHSVTVTFDANPTLPVVIPIYTWEVSAYQIVDTPIKNSLDADSQEPVKKKVEKVKVGEYSQIPLKLAYAITVHKSQGQTFDEINLHPYAWDNGQLYVALSRVKTIEGLSLKTPIYPQYLKVSKNVVNFYKEIYKISQEQVREEKEHRTTIFNDEEKRILIAALNDKKKEKPDQ